MKEHPILFSAPMVRSILEGRKTQTRRPINLDQFQRSDTPGYDFAFIKGHCWQDVTIQKMLDPPYKNYPFKCPFGVIGDQLWVRETFSQILVNSLLEQYGLIYRADGEIEGQA